MRYVLVPEKPHFSNKQEKNGFLASVKTESNEQKKI